MVHHSLTKDGKTVSWQAIRRWHTTDHHHWPDIGYHQGVEMVNDHLEAFIGRPENERAAACKEADMNALALHVCVVGNFDLAPPSDDLLRFLARYVVKPWVVRYGIPLDHVVGHRDFATYKSCPGSMFDLDALRALL
jgi:hypothetical protein